MGNYKNRLQFVHHNELFSTREDAMNYVNGQLIQIDRPALYAEPMVLKYGDEAEPNIILAIGSRGNGEDMSTSNRVFFIDLANIEESIEKLKEQVDKNIEDEENIRDFVSAIIASCGLNEDGTYSKDLDDDILKSAENLKMADALLSSALQDEIARAKAEEMKLILNPQESDTISFELDKQESGTSLTAGVKLAEKKTFDNVNWSNIIVKDENGLFANVDVKYEEDQLVVTINGETKAYNLPKETYIESGYYDKETESIILELNNGGEVYVEMTDLIEEWGVSSIQTSPIMLKKEHVKYDSQLHDEPLWRDVLSADVRLKDGDNNILEKVLVSDEDGTFALYVNGVASNIKCRVGATETTVQDALDNIKHPISTNDNNIIVERVDGLYATVALNYDKASNVLTFDDGIHPSKSIELNSASVLEKAYYEFGELVLRFRMTDNTTNEVRIPISEIVKDFEFNNNGRTVTLVRNQDNGQYYMSADVNVSNDADNILQINNSALYVKGIASNIKYKSEVSVADELDKLNSPEEVVGSIKYEVAKEKLERVSSDNKLSEIIASTQTELDALEDVVNEEITRSENVDAENRKSIDELGAKIETLTSLLNEHKEDFQTHKDDNVASFANVESKIVETNHTLDKHKNESNNALEAAKVESKTYTDNVLVEAKAYADGLSVNYDSVGSAQSALQSAKEYSDNNTITAITKAKEYTDGKAVETLATAQENAAHAISDAASALTVSIDTKNAEAKLYADEQDAKMLETVNDAIAKASQDAEFVTVDTDTIKTVLNSNKELSANVKLNNSTDNILLSDENGLLAQVNLTYDPTTSKLTFNNGKTFSEYYLTSNSLVSDARFDENGKLVLTITLADGTKKEVEVSIDKIEGGNNGDSPVTVNVEQTQEGVKRITATLSVSSNENNLIVADDGSLFASKVASDHIGTYRDNEMTMQEALGRIAEEIDEASKTGGNAGDTSGLQAQIASLQTQVTTLQSNLNAETTARIELENEVNELKAIVEQLTNATMIDFGTYTVTTTDDGENQGGSGDVTPDGGDEVTLEDGDDNTEEIPTE